MRKIATDYQVIPFIFIVQEMQRRSQVHYHFLADWGEGRKVSNFELMDRWKWGHSRIYDIINDEDALRYVSKYCYNDESYYADYWIFDKESLPELANGLQQTVWGGRGLPSGAPPR